MHVAITGASSGIGEALAREMARAGHKLTLVARRRALLDRLAAEIGGETFVREQDLRDPRAATQWVASAEAALGPLDVLVNNAGMSNTGLTAQSDPDTAVTLLHTNLVSPLLLTRHVLPGMIARGRGTIVDVASIAALAPQPLFTWYGASKAGLAAFSESLRGELHGTGVHVVTVYPGPVTTPMAEVNYAAVGGRTGVVGALPEGTADELARRIRRAIERRSARVIYPSFYLSTRWLAPLARWLVDLGARGVVARLRLTAGR
jgi:short-subunit dehydrogenase